MRDRITEVLRTIYDPEIPVNIYDIGLIYEITVGDDGHVHILMTLTSPTCPVAESLPPEVEERVEELEGVTSARVEITWDPPWDPDMMSEAAKLELGMF
jgi:FeS assembly SUF system protein